MEQNWQKSDEQNFLLFFRTFNNKRTKYETNDYKSSKLYTNDYSILSGESGTILTLINGIYLGKEYPKLLMID